MLLTLTDRSLDVTDDGSGALAGSLGLSLNFGEFSEDLSNIASVTGSAKDLDNTDKIYLVLVGGSSNAGLVGSSTLSNLGRGHILCQMAFIIATKKII